MDPKPKVSMLPTGQSPAEQAIAKAQQTFEVIDARCRKIVLKKPPVLTQFRIVEAAGPEAAANVTYMQMVLPLTYVVSVDGDAVFLPTRKSEIEALIQLLDEDGIEAVLKGVTEHWQRPNPEAERQALKNS